MEKSSNHIILIAGEDSGDLHGALLVTALRKQNPNLTFSGLGGPKMKAAGVELDYDLTKLAVVGFIEVLKHYGQFKKIFDMILNKIKDKEPAAVILIDYPGFNLRLAKQLRNVKTKVIYYISPQVWAWKKNRVHSIKKYVDQMLVLFEFEKDFYKQFNMTVDFVGHPLIDTVQSSVTKKDVLDNVGLNDYKTTIGLLPGSRLKEIERHLPIMIDTARNLREEFPMLQFVILKAPSIPKPYIQSMTKKVDFNIPIIEDKIYDGINACEMCLVTSGTATLETAILGKPMVVMYKTSWSTWLLAKMIIKIPYISLVNVVAQKEVVPEHIQQNANPHSLTKAIKNIFTNEIAIASMKQELQELTRSLGNPPVADKAARVILEKLNQD